jgi:hypothetical protein
MRKYTRETLTPRQAAQAKRLCLPVGIALGLLLFGLVRVVFDYKRTDYSGMVLPDVKSWPSVFHGFAPLDLIVACLCGYLCLTAIYRLTGADWPRLHTDSMDFWAYRTVWVFIGFGSLFGWVQASLNGWLSALEEFVLLGGAATGVLGAVVTVGNYLHEVAKQDGLIKGFKSKASTGRPGQLARRTSAHFRATDIPDPRPPASDEHTTLAG